MRNTSGSDRGLGLLSTLLVIFIVLKLVHVIHWPWIWVLAPLWISLLIFVVIAIIFVILTRS